MFQKLVKFPAKVPKMENPYINYCITLSKNLNIALLIIMKSMTDIAKTSFDGLRKFIHITHRFVYKKNVLSVLK